MLQTLMVPNNCYSFCKDGMFPSSNKNKYMISYYMSIYENPLASDNKSSKELNVSSIYIYYYSFWFSCQFFCCQKIT